MFSTIQHWYSVEAKCVVINIYWIDQVFTKISSLRNIVLHVALTFVPKLIMRTSQTVLENKNVFRQEYPFQVFLHCSI